MHKMHTNKRLARPLRSVMVAVLCALVLLACRDFDTPEAEQGLPERVNVSIAHLREMVGERTVHFEQDLVIGGYVTTSDREGNFYRTFCIDDGTAGVEIMAGMYDLHRLYPEGYYVTVRLNGCSAGVHNGVLQVGTRAAAYSNYPTDYFYSRVLIDKHLTRYDLISPVAPIPLRVEQLAEEYCGRMVNVSSLKLIAAPEGGIWSGYCTFADEKGHRVAVYCSPYADFAQQEVPSERVSITGILQYGVVDGGEMYVLKMRYESDCGIYN